MWRYLQLLSLGWLRCARQRLMLQHCYKSSRVLYNLMRQRSQGIHECRFLRGSIETKVCVFCYKFFTVTETIERTSPANREQRECEERWIEKPAETNSLRRFRSYPHKCEAPSGLFLSYAVRPLISVCRSIRQEVVTSYWKPWYRLAVRSSRSVSSFTFVLS